ncbi:MAG TPA: sigma-54 dependent transcriptional regulator [Acidobacteriaceae bacterium]|nr:sigma-54 dependent transcriptional regulator [Acidobacteriaceae bacterium]
MVIPLRPAPGAGKLHLLVADEDPAVRAACCQIAADLGFAPQEASTVTAARAILRGQSIDILLLDLRSPGDGLDLLDEITTLDSGLSVVVMTAYASVASAVESMRTGAADYLTKPFAPDELASVLERAAERRNANSESRDLRERLRSQQGLGNIIGRSPEMEKLYRILAKVAQGSHPVLILGESGVGKELIARAIHANGPHRSRPFIPIDCGSLAPALIENEIFGYVKGAFAGAQRSKDGLLVAAEGGTILLDDIGELSLDLQAKILRALQEKEIRPLGGTQRVPINVRILATTRRDLVHMAESGRFRKDLYYRLNVVNLRIPPLRERKQDIPLLVGHFLDRISRETGVTYTLSDESLHTLNEYEWPGNVRELENALERACSLSSGPILELGHLTTQLQNFRLESRRVAAQPSRVSAETASPETAVLSLAELEKQAILDALRKLNGDKLLAARLLGIGKTTLYRKLKEYGIGDGSPEQSVI